VGLADINKKKITTTQKPLSILLLNIQGMRSSVKFTLFEEYISNLNEKPQIVAITEHWLNAEEVGLVRIRGYQHVANFARKNQMRGGVILFVSNLLKFDNLKLINMESRELHFETAGIQMRLESDMIKIILIYRPSNPLSNSNIGSFFESLENVLEQNVSLDSNMILLGDLNIDLLKPDSSSVKLKGILNGYNMYQEGFAVTRTDGQSATLLDVIFSTFDNRSLNRVIPCPFSDHDIVLCEWNIKDNQKQDTFKMSRKFSDENWQDFYELLLLETWEDVYSGTGDVNIKCDIFMKKLTSYFEKSFPITKTINRINQAGKIKLTSQTMEQKTRLRELGERIKREIDPKIKDILRPQLKSLKKHVALCIANEVKEYNNQRIQKSNNKTGTMWKMIREVKDGQLFSSDEIIRIIEGDEVIENPHNIVELLNEKFIEPMPEEDIEMNELEVQTDKQFFLSSITDEQIFEIIWKLPSKKSYGWDGISTEVLKKVAEYIVGPLTYLVNCSFNEGVFPELMKISEIRPLFKKGSKDDAGNYRPIALTSSFAKIFEKAFLNQLEKYYEMNNFLPDQQHGFRKKRSTVTALFDMVTSVYDSLEKREKLNVILYDFKNAFGSLVPDKLLNKLRMFGVTGVALQWVKSFLLDRKQLVKLKVLNENFEEEVIKSKLQQCNRGVPQGTTMGPFTYSAYSIDLPLLVVLAVLVIFADDSTMLIKGSNSNEVNEKTIVANNDVVNYAKENYLTLNSKKTMVMQMRTAQSKIVVPPEVIINDEELSVVSSSRLLGVTLTNTMNWGTQCSEVASKLRSVTYLFIMLRSKVLEKTLIAAYHAYAESRILYSIVIWGGSSHMSEVFLGQKRVVRAIAGVRYCRSNTALESCGPLFKKYGILTTYSLYILECAKFVKKFPEKFKMYRDVPEAVIRTTRATVYVETNLYVKPCTLNCVNESPERMMARIYNKLPTVLKEMSDYNNFVKCLKRILLEYQFYDMNEFWLCNFENVSLAE
jgi:exonuclease III